MSTIYTVNGKVLKNADNGKWLTKKEVPVFVMDASNTIYTTQYFAFWEAPTYPNACDFDGKSIEVTIKDTGVSFAIFKLQYSDSSTSASGPNAIRWENPDGSGSQSQYLITPGTYQLTGLKNLAGGNYGKYLALSFEGPTNTISPETLAKIEIKVLDP